MTVTEMILTYEELRRALNFCMENDSRNVILFNEGHGIGDVLCIALQDEWLANKDCKKVDITDWESW